MSKVKKEIGTLNGWEIKHRESKRIFILATTSEEEKTNWCDLLNKATGIAQARNASALKATPKFSEMTIRRLRNLGAFQRGAVESKELDDDPTEEPRNPVNRTLTGEEPIKPRKQVNRSNTDKLEEIEGESDPNLKESDLEPENGDTSPRGKKKKKMYWSNRAAKGKVEKEEGTPSKVKEKKKKVT